MLKKEKRCFRNHSEDPTPPNSAPIPRSVPEEKKEMVVYLIELWSFNLNSRKMIFVVERLTHRIFKIAQLVS